MWTGYAMSRRRCSASIRRAVDRDVRVVAAEAVPVAHARAALAQVLAVEPLQVEPRRVVEGEHVPVVIGVDRGLLPVMPPAAREEPPRGGRIVLHVSVEPRGRVPGREVGAPR